jgi:RecA-family ATPase
VGKNDLSKTVLEFGPQKATGLISEAIQGGNGVDLSWLQFEDVDDLPEAEPEVVIEGLLRIGEKLGITAGTKRFKTWLLLYIAYCIANGIDFLGFKTVKSKVAFFDLELSRNGLKRRLNRIQKAVGSGDFKNLKICSLRGKASLFCRNFPKIKSIIAKEQFKVVIIDPVYKFLLGKNESDNGMVAQMLEDLTVFCMETEVGMVYVHHHSKGNQAGKESLDRGSGAGAWSRDPDAVLDLSEHKTSTPEDRIFTAEVTLRDFPANQGFCRSMEVPALATRHHRPQPLRVEAETESKRRPAQKRH